MKDKAKRIVEERENPRAVILESIEGEDTRDLTKRILDGEDPKNVLGIKPPVTLPDQATKIKKQKATNYQKGEEK
jgi:hypothetical protein